MYSFCEGSIVCMFMNIFIFNEYKVPFSRGTGIKIELSKNSFIRYKVASL